MHHRGHRDPEHHRDHRGHRDREHRRGRRDREHHRGHRDRERRRDHRVHRRRHRRRRATWASSRGWVGACPDVPAPRPREQPRGAAGAGRRRGEQAQQQPRGPDGDPCPGWEQTGCCRDAEHPDGHPDGVPGPWARLRREPRAGSDRRCRAAPARAPGPPRRGRGRGWARELGPARRRAPRREPRPASDRAWDPVGRRSACLRPHRPMRTRLPGRAPRLRRRSAARRTAS